MAKTQPLKVMSTIIIFQVQKVYQPVNWEENHVKNRGGFAMIPNISKGETLQKGVSKVCEYKYDKNKVT